MVGTFVVYISCALIILLLVWETGVGFRWEEEEVNECDVGFMIRL